MKVTMHLPDGETIERDLTLKEINDLDVIANAFGYRITVRGKG